MSIFGTLSILYYGDFEHFERFMAVFLRHFGVFGVSFGAFWDISWNFGEFWGILGHFGAFWGILGHFRAF